MEQDYAAQIQQYISQISQTQDALAQSESQVRNERDRVRRYAGKVDDLRTQLAALKNNDNPETFVSELSLARQSYMDLSTVVKETIVAVLGGHMDLLDHTSIPR